MTYWTTDNVPPFAAALVRAYHALLAAAAREHYPRDGRGVVTLIWRGTGPPADVPAIAELRIGYWPLARYRTFTSPHTTGSVRACADNVIHRIETYEPSTQFVVAVVVGPSFLTVPLTVPLDPPVIVKEADGVH